MFIIEVCTFYRETPPSPFYLSIPLVFLMTLPVNHHWQRTPAIVITRDMLQCYIWWSTPLTTFNAQLLATTTVDDYCPVSSDMLCDHHHLPKLQQLPLAIISNNYLWCPTLHNSYIRWPTSTITFGDQLQPPTSLIVNPNTS